MKQTAKTIRRTALVVLMAMIAVMGASASAFDDFIDSTGRFSDVLNNVINDSAGITAPSRNDMAYPFPDEVHPDWGSDESDMMSVASYESTFDNGVAKYHFSHYTSPFDFYHPVYRRGYGLIAWYSVAVFEDEISASVFARNVGEALDGKYRSSYDEDDTWENSRRNETIRLYKTFDIDNSNAYRSDIRWYVVVEYAEKENSWRHREVVDDIAAFL